MGLRVRLWLSLAGIVLLQSFNGTNFNFPMYSSKLKHELFMTQFQINNLAFASDVGKFFGFIPGLLALHLLPLSAILFIGSILCFLGYGLQFLIVTHRLHNYSYWIILFLSAMAGNSFSWINTVCNVIAVQNFPSYRHLALGISTSYQRLSPMIYTNIVHSISSSKSEFFLLFSSLMPLGVSTLVFPLARVLEVEQDKGVYWTVGFTVFFLITIMTGMVSGITTTIPKMFSPSIDLVGILVFLLLNFIVPLAEKLKELISKKVGNEKDSTEDVEKSAPKSVKSYGNKMGIIIEEIGALQMVKRLNFWLYFGVYLFGPTIGIAFLNNLGQIAESRGISNVSLVVSLTSSFSFFGSLMPSLADSIVYRNKYMKSRPGWLMSLMVLMCTSFFLLSCPTDWCLYLSSAIIGVCIGAITSISLSLTVDLFGKQNFSLNHSILVVNIPLGTFLYGLLAATVYNNHTSSADGKCMGTMCYKTTFLLWGAFCCLGTFFAFVLYIRTKIFYYNESCIEENSM